jgi:hypothetical protein
MVWQTTASTCAELPVAKSRVGNVRRCCHCREEHCLHSLPQRTSLQSKAAGKAQQHMIKQLAVTKPVTQFELIMPT